MKEKQIVKVILSSDRRLCVTRQCAWISRGNESSQHILPLNINREIIHHSVTNLLFHRKDNVLLTLKAFYMIFFSLSKSKLCEILFPITVPIYQIYRTIIVLRTTHQGHKRGNKWRVKNRKANKAGGNLTNRAAFFKWAWKTGAFTKGPRRCWERLWWGAWQAGHSGR